MDEEPTRRPRAVHIYDISGTGWAHDDCGDVGDFLDRIATMNRERDTAGLPPVPPLAAMPDNIPAGAKGHDLNAMENEIEAGNGVYLVDFSLPGAASAAYHAGLDFDGMLGQLPAGRVVQLIDTGGRTVWHAATVAEVSRLESSINWLTEAMTAAELDPPARGGVQMLSATWPLAVIRRAVEGIAAGHAVWTISLDSPQTFELARLSGLPGFIRRVNGTDWALTRRMTPEAMIDAAERAERRAAFARGEAERHADGRSVNVNLGRNVVEGVPMTAAATLVAMEEAIAAMEDRNRWMTTGGKTSMVDFMLHHFDTAEADAVEATKQAERDRYEFSRFAWTDSDGDLQSGDFGDLVADAERRAAYDHGPIAHVYAVTTDARLELVGWTVEGGQGYGSDDYAHPVAVVILPDGFKLRREYRVDGRG